MQTPLYALILAAGRGTRMGHHTEQRNKCFIRFGEDHLIANTLNIAAELHVARIVIVVGYYADPLMHYIGTTWRSIPVEYLHQPRIGNMMDGIRLALPHLPGDTFLFLGDEYYMDCSHRAMLHFFNRTTCDVVCGIVHTACRELVKKNYSVIFDEGRVQRLLEKPAEPPNNWIGTGSCLFRQGMLCDCEGPRESLIHSNDLPGFLQRAVDAGADVRAFNLEGHYVNLNSPGDLRLLYSIQSVRRPDPRASDGLR